MINKLVLVKTNTKLSFIGKKNFFKNLFSWNTLILDDAYFIDFFYTDNRLNKIYLTSFEVMRCINSCRINKQRIIFQCEPNYELEELYEGIKNEFDHTPEL